MKEQDDKNDHEWTPSASDDVDPTNDYIEDFSKEAIEETRKTLLEYARSKKYTPNTDPIALPSDFKGTLKDYQNEGFQWLVERRQRNINTILGDEMGLGKTVQAIVFMLHVKALANGQTRQLVVVPLSVAQNWLDELQKFSPSLSCTMYLGDMNQRTVIQKQWFDSPTDILLTTYEMCMKDEHFFQKPFDLLLVDEAHRLKNEKSQLYRMLMRVPVKHKLLLTGTPIQNNLCELYALLKFIDHETFKFSKDIFEQCFVSSGQCDYMNDLTEIVDTYMLRRCKDTVLSELPIKKEVTIYTGLSEVQKRIYKAILTKNIHAFESKQKQALNNVLIHLRKCVDHPYLFTGVEPEPFKVGEHLITASGKLWIMDHLLKRLKEKGHRVLIFSQMTSMLDILQDYLDYRNYSYERLDGSVRGDERYVAIDRFKQSSDIFVFLLSTRAGGVGLNLVQADTAIFFDSDFNPQMDLQASARIHRLGQQKPVTVIRLVARGTVEDIILLRAGRKLNLANKILKYQPSQVNQFDDEKDLSTVLKFGLDDLLRDEKSTVVDDDLKQFDFVENDTMSEKLESKENIYMFSGTNYAYADESAFQSLRQDAVLDEENNALEPRKRKAPERISNELLASVASGRKKKAASLTKEERWRKYNYQSSKLPPSIEDEETRSYRELDMSDNGIHYVKGNVTQPKSHQLSEIAVIAHCVDDSGQWTRGGVFGAITKLTNSVEIAYAKAKKMSDVHLGDIHLFQVPVDCVHNMKSTYSKIFVGLIVAQHRDRNGNISDVNQDAVKSGLSSLASWAKCQRATIHIPRIGLSRSDWYAIEKLVLKELTRVGLEVFVYYFSRHNDRNAPSRAESSASEKQQSSLFNSVNFMFVGIDDPERPVKDHFIRLLVARGATETTNEDEASHIFNLSTSPQKGYAQLLYCSWITDCIKAGRLLNTKYYTNCT